MRANMFENEKEAKSEISSFKLITGKPEQSLSYDFINLIEQFLDSLVISLAGICSYTTPFIHQF